MLTAKQARELTDKAKDEFDKVLNLIERSAKEGCSSLSYPVTPYILKCTKKLKALGFTIIENHHYTTDLGGYRAKTEFYRISW